MNRRGFIGAAAGLLAILKDKPACAGLRDGCVHNWDFVLQKCRDCGITKRTILLLRNGQRGRFYVCHRR